MGTEEVRRIAADVVVIGGGTAGFGAAVAAARLGLETHLFEASSKVGGVMAFCPGMPWGAAYPCDASIGGLMEELAGRLYAMAPPAAEKRPCTLENFGSEIQYDHDIATLTMFEMLEEAGVHLHLNATVTGPDMNNGRAAAVNYVDRHGPGVVEPLIVIDCSGDGDFSAKSGVPFALGDGQGNMMGVTVSFMMTHADWSRVFADGDPYFRKFAAKGIAEGLLQWQPVDVQIPVNRHYLTTMKVRPKTLTLVEYYGEVPTEKKELPGVWKLIHGKPEEFRRYLVGDVRPFLAATEGEEAPQSQAVEENP